jgi:hypothetical protein
MYQVVMMIRRLIWMLEDLRERVLERWLLLKEKQVYTNYLERDPNLEEKVQSQNV